jgi:ABC-type uncharacterized transport system involved in gliding motility auxiliary subunit
MYGLGAVYVTRQMGRLSVLFVVLGAAALLICFARVRQLSPRFSSAFPWKTYFLSMSLVILWSALFVEVNIWAYRNNRRWDLTKFKQHTLSDNTQKIIGDLGREVRLTAFYAGLPPRYLEDMFREYGRLSDGKIKAEIIDPIVEIGYAAQFGNVIRGREHKVFVQSGARQKEVDFTQEVLTEEQLTNAVVQVTRELRHVYFLVGHNEYSTDDDEDAGLKEWATMLSANRVVVQKLMLGVSGRIPDDCDVLVIAGPKDHLTKKEEEIIGGYLVKGGDALFLIENMVVTTPDKPLTREEQTKNPSLNSILNGWGINVADDVVVDLASHASGDVGSPATRNYMAHRSIVNDLDYTFFVRPRSISIRPGRRSSVRVAPIILTASKENSWGETNRNLDVKFDPGTDRAGPVPIAFAVWEPKEKGEASDTRLIVITDADFLTNAFIGQYSNARLGLNAVNWLSEVDYQAFMEKKRIDVQRLDLTSQQKREVVVALFLMPFLIAVRGVFVWLKRRVA